MSCSSNGLNSCQINQNCVENYSCCSQNLTSATPIWLIVAEKISAIALAAFSAYTDVTLFTQFFFVGVAIGIYNYMDKADNNVGNHHVSACSQGVLEQLTGVRLPAAISLAVNIAVTACHIDHHATVFVPIVGLSIGAWVGQKGSSFIEQLHDRFTMPDLEPIS